ncbi:hypothetical protein [Streptomyces sp. NPDC058653]|uniref:hypothetical protein n=1 Tax=Streptomyces sp. NPDC058653 TaxID=3346576 RepID=UPI0036465299
MSPRSGRPRNVPALLNSLHQNQYTGAVRLPGSPGGSIHLREGLVISVETPAAPSAESILLKTGRVADAVWASTVAASSASGNDLKAELAARGVIGPEEFEVVCAATVFDGAFALALNPPGDWELTESGPSVVAGVAVQPQRLTAETTRRTALLTGLWGPPSEFARTRIRQAGAAVSRVQPRYLALLSAVNERRNPRDIAFAVGRGLYAVMLDLSRMQTLGLIRRDSPAPAGRPSTAPRAVNPRKAPPATPASPLPRRAPGNHRPPRPGTT